MNFKDVLAIQIAFAMRSYQYLAADQYAHKKPVRDDQPHLFDSHLGAGHWITIGGEKNADGSRDGGHAVFVGKDGEMKTGAFAGKTMKEAFGSKKTEPSKPAIEEQPKTKPNNEAKPGEQLGLFGEVRKETSSKPAEVKTESPTKGKQQGLFTTTGKSEQMVLFGDGSESEDMVHKPAESKPSDPVALSDAKALAQAFTDKIADFGEKIGGARKDTATKIGPRAKIEKPKDDRPAWQRRYHVAEDASKPGEYFIVDQVTQQPIGAGENPSPGSFSQELAKRLGKMGRKLSNFENFKSKEDAEAMVPHIAVNRNHSIRNLAKRDEPANWAIVRHVAESKRPAVKAGFKSHDEAQQYLDKNPEKVIEYEFPDWEEYSYLTDVKRTGKDHRPGGKDVKPTDFQQDFNFRGGEFGKWQMNKDGQTSLNHAFDALHDLADTLNLPPRAMSLNGQLAIAFGSRGTGGKHSAKAHYEPDKAVINLTKMKGAGSLAHEWFHSMDHYLAKQVYGDDKTEYLLSERVPSGERKGRSEMVSAFRDLMQTITTQEVDEKITGNDQVISRSKKYVVDMVGELEKMIDIRMKQSKRAKGLSPEDQKEWDFLKEKVIDLEVGKKMHIDGGYSSPQTYENLQKMNELYKKATGRSFHTNDTNSYGHKIYWAIWRARNEHEKLKMAQEGKTIKKRGPSDFANNAQILDSHRAKSYFTKHEELAARAFQAYVYDKTEAQGKPTQYLNANAHNGIYAGMQTPDGELVKPFPEGEERKRINAAFDRFFSTLSHREREDEKGKHVELYSQNVQTFIEHSFDLVYYSNAFLRDMYEWDPSLHPRDEMGRFAENQLRSTRVREVVERPDVSRTHPLHLNNQSNEIKLAASDAAKAFRNLWAQAGRKSGLVWSHDTEEQIWDNVDKDRLRQLLDATNKLDRHYKELGKGSLDEAFNYNGIIPKQFADRLHGGSRFFDPEKLRGRWNEQRQQSPVEAPTRLPGDDDEKIPHEAKSAAQPKRFGSFDDLKNAFQRQLAPQITGVSKQKLGKLDKYIRSSIADNDDVVNAFTPIVVQAWKDVSREAEDHNQAIREIMGVAKNYLQSAGYASGATSRSPQSLAAFVRKARAQTMDPSKQRGFDEMVDRAERNFPHLLQGRGEDGLMDLLSQGIQKAPDLLGQEVAERAMTMAGPTFFESAGLLNKESQASEPDWETVPFSWLCIPNQINIWRYSNPDWADQVRDEFGRWVSKGLPKIDPSTLDSHKDSGDKLRHWLRSWALQNIRDKKIKNIDTGLEIEIDKEGIKKTAAQATDSAMALLVLPELIEKAEFDREELNQKDAATSPGKKFLYFRCAATLEEKTLAVRLIVRSSEQIGHKAYSLHAVEIEKGSPQIPGGRQSSIEPGGRRAPEINIDRAWEKIKRGNDYYSSSLAVSRYQHSEAQLEAGNYPKKHIRVHGLEISIETPKGERRRPEWPIMSADYGYFRGTVGADGDHLDVFVGPNQRSEMVFIVDQVDQSEHFDEHKVLIGYDTQDDAIEAYRKCYTPDWKVGPVTAMTIWQFKNWLKQGKQTRPVGKQVSKYSLSNC